MLENILIVLYTEDSSPLDPPFITTCINVVIHVYRTKVVQLSKHGIIQFSSLSCIRLFATPWTEHARPPCPSPEFTCPPRVYLSSQSLPKLMSIESVMPSNLLILCPPLLLLPSILPSIRVFSNVSVLHIRWPKY